MKTFRACLVAGVALLPGAAFAQDNDITIALNEELELLDPCMTSQSNIGRVLQQNVAETLTELDSTNGNVDPRLAVSWEEGDGGTWRFKLRDGVTFSDGSTLDAADVARSIERITSKDLTCEIGNKFFGGIKLSTAVVDPQTIDITADPAQPILPLLMSTVTVVPSETPMQFTREPVGTGPYRFVSYTPGQSIVLERRDDYWGDKPEVTKATYVFRSDDAVRAAMVAAGEADIVPQISQSDATNPATDFSYPNSETTYLRVDNQVAPLNDIRIRKAMNLAVDRDAFLGTLIPADAIKATHMVPPGALGFDDTLQPFPYDPEQAKALIAEAKADGVPVDTEIVLIGRLGHFPNVTELHESLQQMFSDVGLNVKLQMVEVAEWIKLYSKPFENDGVPRIVTGMHDNNRGDPVFSMYFKYACDGLQSGVCDKELDQLIADATAASGEERGPKWTAVFDRAFTTDVADVFLYHMVGFSRVGERLDFKPTIATNSELQLSQIKFKK